MSYWLRERQAYARGGKGRWTPRADNWRAKYGSPPTGDPLKAATLPCFGCSHTAHQGERCAAIALFTKKQCECPGR